MAKNCLFPNYPCSWFIQYIYIYPIACIWHMAYGLTTTSDCWKTITILLNYTTSYHITLHYSFSIVLNYCIVHDNIWYIYIYKFIFIFIYYPVIFYPIKSYSNIFLFFVDYIHPYVWSFNSRHSPSPFSEVGAFTRIPEASTSLMPLGS